jgi:hypothetical protein
MELVGLRGFEREFAAHGDAEAVAGPLREGDVQHASTQFTPRSVRYACRAEPAS